MNKMWVRNGGYALLVFVALGVGIMLTSKSGDISTTQYIQRYPHPRPLSAFSIEDQNGHRFGLEQLKRHWTLAFIGYTYCPDVCPTTLAKLNQIYPALRASAGTFPVQVLFISVDPKRDTIARLSSYIGFFNSHFVAATADHKTLYPLVRQLGLVYSMTDNSDNHDYAIAHSSSVVVIDPLGRVVGRFKASATPGQPAIIDGQHLLADMPILMSAQRPEE